MPPNIEIERKFLIDSPPKGWRQWPHENIRQGYFPIRNRSLEIRLRQKAAQYFLTVKAGNGKMRQEEEIRISQKQFDSLWPLTQGRRIAKVRYETRIGENKVELDAYAAPRKSLVTAEVEFASPQESRRFQPPEWFGREITGNQKYSNQYLARHRR